jgi:hypothetical protein
MGQILNAKGLRLIVVFNNEPYLSSRLLFTVKGAKFVS